MLNEIIIDFDSILDEKKFKSVDKIKTIGSTYMAAVGLFPQYELPSDPIDWPVVKRKQSSSASGQTGNGDHRKYSSACDVIQENQPTKTTGTGAADQSNERSSSNDTNQAAGSSEWTEEAVWDNRRRVAHYLHTLVQFVMEMRNRLQDINEHSYNNFKLRVGINYGPVTAGVIGASKPQYDIWGNTVNVASRMETTAETGKIQITEDVYQILKDFNEGEKLKFTCRGRINVKGKGIMTTYYLEK